MREHLLDGRAGSEPAAAVVDAVDEIEFLRGGVVGFLVVAENACFDRIVSLECSLVLGISATNVCLDRGKRMVDSYQLQ